MGKALDFIKKVSKDLHIEKDERETESERVTRVAYSASIQSAVASLCDITGTEECTVSVQAFKNNFKNNILAFNRIYPLEKWFTGTVYQMTEEVYSVLLKTGIMYHKTNRLCSCNYASCQIGDVRLLRGDNPLRFTSMSGGGQYVKDTVSSGTYNSAEEMFCLYGINGTNGEDITAKKSDSLVYVSVPKADTQIRNILMLYSWATSDAAIRAVSVDAWPAIEGIMCDGGYHISYISG